MESRLKKKALLVARVGGFVPQFEMNHVALLQKMGYEVHYASNFKTIVYGRNLDRLQGTGIICHDIPFCRSPFSWRVFEGYFRLKKLMLDEPFDLIHCHMPMTGVVARMAAQAVRRKTGRNIPVLYTAHGFHFFQGAPIRNWIYYVPERWLARYTDRLLTINSEDYERAGTFPVRGRVEKISGVGIKILPETDEGKAERSVIRLRKRKELGIASEEYVLISVGELNANKNHRQVIRALAGSMDRSLKYMICGTGVMKDRLEEEIQRFGLQDQVFLLGYRTDVRELLFASDCFVFPSLREGLPVALMEAMGAGLPVVAKRIRGNVDLIEEGKGGFLLEKGTREEYRESIQRLRDDEKLAARMGEWNQRKVREFSEETVMAQMKYIYEEVSE